MLVIHVCTYNNVNIFSRCFPAPSLAERVPMPWLQEMLCLRSPPVYVLVALPYNYPLTVTLYMQSCTVVVLWHWIGLTTVTHTHTHAHTHTHTGWATANDHEQPKLCHKWGHPSSLRLLRNPWLPGMPRSGRRKCSWERTTVLWGSPLLPEKVGFAQDVHWTLSYPATVGPNPGQISETISK